MAFDELKVADGSTPVLSVVYVKHIGAEIDGSNIYHMYISSNPDEVFAEGWGDIPACTVPRKLMDLDGVLF